MSVSLAIPRRPIIIVVRPVDEVCNLSCTYCNAASYNITRPRLKVRLLDRLIRHASLLDYAHVQFVWHGGEPLVAGKEYFRRIVNFQCNAFSDQKCNSTYENVVQTNGLLLDDYFLDFLTEHKFHIGISLDGPDIECNYYRFPSRAAPQLLSKTIDAITRIVNQGSDILVIGVVHDKNAHRAHEIYDFYSDLGVTKISFNPRYLKYDQNKNIGSTEFMLFLKDLIEARNQSFLQGKRRVSIGIVDDLIRAKSGGSPRICFFNNLCHKFFNVNSTGEIFASCTDALGVSLGNILTDNLDDVINTFSKSPNKHVLSHLGKKDYSSPNAIGPGCPKYSIGVGDSYLRIYKQLMASNALM